MCFHKAQSKPIEKIAEYYDAKVNDEVTAQHEIRFHENGFDFKPSAILRTHNPTELAMYNWGFMAYFNKTLESAFQARVQTLNCISQEMYDKPTFMEAAKAGQRCLIPCSGFMEWRWMDEKGKIKIPYYVHLKEQQIFSLAGLYGHWRDPLTEKIYHTYTILTTTANPLMSEIHNSKKRMPAIIPRASENDYLNPTLSKDDVLSLCTPLNDSLMGAHTISKLITSKTENSDVAKVIEPFRYEAPPKDAQTSLF